MNQMPMFFSAQEMSADFMKRLREGFKGDCPCCGRHAQVYKRQLYGTSVRMLIVFYRLGAAEKFVHYSDAVKQFGLGHIGDFNKAKYWGLVKKKPNDDESKSSSGSWMITEAGKDFILGKSSIHETAYVFDDQVIAFSEQLVGVKEALGHKFDYQQLMEG